MAQTKPEIALDEIDRVRAAGIRFGCVLADAGYGLSAAFRQGLGARGLVWSVGITRTQTLFTTGVGLLFPRVGRGKPRQHAVPSEDARSAADVLAAARWRRIAWRQGSKGPLAARFAALRVRVADGPRSPRHGHLPGEEVWLVGEWRSSGERKYYLSNLPPGTSLRHLAATIKARWVCEQAHQQLKQELGLGAFEGRSWTGLHRHALMSCIAFAYLQHCGSAPRRVRKRKLLLTTAPPKPTLPEIRRALIARLFAPPKLPSRCPHCRRRLHPHSTKVPR